VSQAELGEKVVGPLWTDTRDAILERLDRVTMEDLCRRARKLGIAHGVKMTPDFNI
jgi:DNA-binding IscR family transcriptional regulator